MSIFKGIHLNTGLTYRNLQHLNGDESRNDHAPFKHFVIFSLFWNLQPLQYFESSRNMGVIDGAKWGEVKIAVKKGFEAKPTYRKSDTFIFSYNWKARTFFALFGVCSCKAVPLHAIHCLHSGGTCRHRHLSFFFFKREFTSLALPFEDTLRPKKPFRSKTNCVYVDNYWRCPLTACIM